MALLTDLNAYCRDIYNGTWSERNGTVVPTTQSITAANDGVHVGATVLYADIADSTVMVDKYKPWFCAEVYKSFLWCAGKIIHANGGQITAYDGDRVMAVFLSGTKNTDAIKAALQINYAARNAIQPQLKAKYPTSTFELKHVCGIDTSKLFVAKTGFRGSDDLVWVGRAANYAAKLAALPETRQTYITSEVYAQCNPEGRIGNGQDMWTKYRWNTFDDRDIYGTNWDWFIS